MLLVVLLVVHVLQVIQEEHVKQTFDQVQIRKNYPLEIYLFSSAFCGINCSPGYCFSNPASQPPYACYCTDNTIQLNSCNFLLKK